MMPVKTDVIQHIRTHLQESAAIKQQVADLHAETMVEAAAAIAGAFRMGGKLLLCGNGGSAADCQHMAAEFVSRLTRERERPALPAIALTTDTSFLTAFANDCGYEGVFARQVQALGRPGDVLIGISTSGNSPNVVRAIQAAIETGMQTIALTGDSGILAGMAHFGIAVPSSSTQYVQESHLAIEHLLCHLVEEELYGN